MIMHRYSKIESLLLGWIDCRGAYASRFTCLSGGVMPIQMQSGLADGLVNERVYFGPL